ncbi:hypothetical protein [Rhizobium sp. LjRoot254]|uniref:hypothetical protein n=1 Tax=Rhizobium sp. LjRoot254 TaxID=3342297 RepID=UPI003ED0BD58
MSEQIQTWETDPASGLQISVERPRIDGPPFAFFFPLPAPDPDPDSATPAFRYWNAAAALRRGADFWGPAMGPNAQWFTGPVLEVRLDAGADWNAVYNRRKLLFHRGVLNQDTVIYAAESADMLCHELGHAMLDIAQPNLWNTCHNEIAAFHESFGDVSAILCALQIPSVRNSVLAVTGGAIFQDTALSRIAKQFGTALHTLRPDEADSNCLRNAHNSFSYVPPETLNSTGSTAVLTSSPHSFSRVFTRAMLEALEGMMAVHASATPDRLHDITLELRDIMIEAVKRAPLVQLYYASVAAKMMLAAREKNEAYETVFRDIFVARSILSSASADAILSSPTPQEDTGFAGEIAENSRAIITSSVASERHGLTEAIEVEISANPLATTARSAVEDASLSPLSPEEAATMFVDRLFERGLVDIREEETESPLSEGLVTHRIERIGGRLHLKRVSFQFSQSMAARRHYQEKGGS